MKTQIEAAINPHHKDFSEIMKELNEVIGITVGNTNFQSITSQLNILTLKYLIFGSGANHIWVSIKETNERILIITE